MILESSPEGVARTVLSEYSVGVYNTAGVSFIVDALNPGECHVVSRSRTPLTDYRTGESRPSQRPPTWRGTSTTPPVDRPSAISC